MKQDNTYTVHVPEDKAGYRLDRLLAEALSDISRTRLKALIEEGQVELAGKPVKSASIKTKSGEEYQVLIPPVRPPVPEGQDIPLEVLYEDNDLLVINKPVGLVVHPAAGNPDGTLVNALIAHCGDSLSGIGGVSRPGIVHRLDKGTSGTMVVAKNDIAHRNLSEQFARHSLERAYQAIVWGVPSPYEGKITGQIGRSPHNRKKMAVVEKGGKYACTNYKVIEQYGRVASLVECRLETGRTHQIRVHMASIGHSVIGDPVYGRNPKGVRSRLPEDARLYINYLNNQLLHAYLIGFEHPMTQKFISINIKLSNQFNNLIEILKKS